MRILPLTLAMALVAVQAGAAVFQVASQRVQVGPNPSAIAVADLNDDGFPDIVTADTGALSDPRQERPANDELSVLLTTGPMAYEPIPRLRSDFAPYDIAIANMDALKAPDIIVASFMAVRTQDIALFRNMGDKLFEPLYFGIPDETLPYLRNRDSDDEPVFTVPGLTSIAVADFNQDRFRDIIATAWSSDLLVHFQGRADVYLAEPQFIAAPGGPRRVRVLDVDGDGALDLAVALYNANEVGLWKGDGTGGFAAAGRFMTRGRLPSDLEVGDINGDGKPDLIVSHSYSEDSIVVFYGDGTFSYGTSQELLVGPDRHVLEHEIRDITVADMNGDSRLDIAAACFASRSVAVFLNSSEDSALPQKFVSETYPFDQARPRALCAGDLDNNGATDLAVALWDANAVGFLMGKAPTTKK